MRKRAFVIGMGFLTTSAAMSPTLVPASATASATPVVRHLRVIAKPLWYSVSLALPEGSSYSIDMRWGHVKPWIGDGCFGFTRLTDGYTQGFGGSRAALPNAHYTSDMRGEYLVIKARPQSIANDASPGTLPDSVIPNVSIETGKETPRGVRSPYWNNGRCLIRHSRSSSVDSRVDLLYYVASREPISYSDFTFRASRGVKVLKEAWGTSTRFVREYDFEQGVSARLGGSVEDDSGLFLVSHDTLVMIGAAKRQAFRLRAATVFQTGWFGPPSPYWDRRLDGGLISVESPGQSDVLGFGGHPADKMPPSVNQWRRDLGHILFVGSGRGTYTYRVDALAAPAIFEGREMALWEGKVPFVVLATADADFPACQLLRVRTRARDKHPVCY